MATGLFYRVGEVLGTVRRVLEVFDALVGPVDE
jgi:hypothetical protein